MLEREYLKLSQTVFSAAYELPQSAMPTAATQTLSFGVDEISLVPSPAR
jgi:hypothetical protein